MLEKLIKKSIHILGKKKEMPVISSSDTDNDLRQREKELFGEDRVRLQRLYEKWVVKETWLLHDEAIPLLLAIDPTPVWISGRWANMQDIVLSRDCYQ